MPEPRARLIVAELHASGARVRLGRKESAHARARRLREGDAVVLLDGTGREATARIARVSRDVVEVIVEEVGAEAASASGITLLVCAIRPERLAWLAEKGTELQARRIVLVESARTQSFRAAPAVVERLGRVARAAAKQSEQSVWPEIAGPVRLAEALALEESSPRFFLDFGARALPGTLPVPRAAVLVGPEGGWTPEEKRAASAKGWKAVQLPAGKLRAETAAIAALVLLRAAIERHQSGPRADPSGKRGSLTR